MWFKTRVSLFELPEPHEFMVADHPEAKKPFRSVYVGRIEQHFEYKGIFGSAKVSNSSRHLAAFHKSDSNDEAIAECMKLIEEAIRTDAKICDLSAMGDRDAWPESWNQIAWQP